MVFDPRGVEYLPVVRAGWLSHPTSPGVGIRPCTAEQEQVRLRPHYAHYRYTSCPYLLSSETTAKGTGLEKLAGKEDTVELESSLAL